MKLQDVITLTFTRSNKNCVYYLNIHAVPWLRLLVAGLPPCMPRFDPREVHMGFVVDKVALGQVFL
jgi:hypothetical protein